MTIQVHLNPDTEARLIAKARSQGVSLEKLAERLLKEALTAGLPPHGVLTRDELQPYLAGRTSDGVRATMTDTAIKELQLFPVMSLPHLDLLQLPAVGS